MAVRISRKGMRAKAVRQSVTLPAPLAAEVRRVAKARHLTMSRALVSLAERGVKAEMDAEATLRHAYQTFMDEKDVGRKEVAGRNLMRTIFGKDAIAEDSIF